MRALPAAFRRLPPLGWLAWGVYALEGAVFRAAPPGEDWPLLFRMLWSFDCFSLPSYRERLLLPIWPEVLLEDPYCPDDDVDRPHMWCDSEAVRDRYLQPEWRDAPWPELLERLPKNEFGYLHPEPDCLGFWGVSQEAHRRLEALYRQSPAPVLDLLDRGIGELSDFTLSVLDGAPPRPGPQLWQALAEVLAPLPPAEPFQVYRARLLEKPPEHAARWSGLGRPRPREALALPHLYV